MFEAAELGRKVSREEFDTIAPGLRTELLDLQRRLREADFPVVIVFAGVDGAGKNETANLLNEWMDPRWTVTRAYGKPSDEEGDRPPFWRYWRDLPPKGKIGMFLSSWYHAPLLDRVHEQISVAEMDERLIRINRFEKALADDGALIVKFWMHLSQKAQKKRLKKLEDDPLTAWQVTPVDWQHYKLYDKFTTAAERLIMQSSKGHALWHIVEGADARYRYSVVLNILKEAITAHLERRDAMKNGGGRAEEKTQGQGEEGGAARGSGPAAVHSVVPGHDPEPGRRRSTIASFRNSAAACRCCTGKPRKRVSRPSWCSKVGTPPARAGPSAA